MKNGYVKSGYPKVSIKKNIMHLEETVLQLDNVSSIKPMIEPDIKYPWWVIAMALFGAWMLWQGESTPGWIFLVVALVIIFIIVYMNENRREYLGITLNSGEVYLISCKNKEFLLDAMREMEEGMTWKNGNAIINFNNSHIEQFVQGTYIENLSIETWNEIENIWEKSLHECKIGTTEYNVIAKARELTKQRDERGLVAFLQRNKDGIFTGVVTEAIKLALAYFLKIPTL